MIYICIDESAAVAYVSYQNFMGKSHVMGSCQLAIIKLIMIAYGDGMFLFATNGLVNKMARDAFTQKETLKFLVVYALYFVGSGFLGEWALLVVPQLIADISPAPIEVISFKYISVGLASLCSLFFCYKKNSRVDGRKFLERYVCLAVPVAVQIGFIWVAVNLVKYGFDLLIPQGPIDYAGCPEFDFWAEFLATLAFYWRMVDVFKKMEFVASSQNGIRADVLQGTKEKEE